MPGTAASDEPRRSAKWEARREVIIDTSARVFARRGYHATGIAELCTVNGLGKGAFYHYIGSKEELLAAIHDRVMDEVMVGADRVAERGRVAVRAARDARRRAARRHPPLSRSRLGLPPRVPGADGRARRAVPRAPARVRAHGSRRSCRPASIPASSVRSTRGSPPSRGSACTTTRTCGSSRAAACRRATSRSRSPTSSSAGSRTSAASGNVCRVSQVHVVPGRGRCGCARRCSGGSCGPARGGWGGRCRRGRSSATPGTGPRSG